MRAASRIISAAFDIETGRRDYRAIGEGCLEGDGQPSFAPDQNRIVTDRNVAARLEKRLMVYNINIRQDVLLISFPMRRNRGFV